MKFFIVLGLMAFLGLALPVWAEDASGHGADRAAMMSLPVTSPATPEMSAPVVKKNFNKKLSRRHKAVAAAKAHRTEVNLDTDDVETPIPERGKYVCYGAACSCGGSP